MMRNLTKKDKMTRDSLTRSKKKKKFQEKFINNILCYKWGTKCFTEVAFAFLFLIIIIQLNKCEICEEENEIHFRYFLKLLRFTSHLIDWQVLWKLREKKEKLCEKFRGKTKVREMERDDKDVVKVGKLIRFISKVVYRRQTY